MCNIINFISVQLRESLGDPARPFPSTFLHCQGFDPYCHMALIFILCNSFPPTLSLLTYHTLTLSLSPSQAIDGFLLVLAGDATVLYASDSLQGHVGLNPRDVIGHSIHDIVQSKEDSEIIRDNLQPRGEGIGRKRGLVREGGRKFQTLDPCENLALWAHKLLGELWGPYKFGTLDHTICRGIWHLHGPVKLVSNLWI